MLRTTHTTTKSCTHMQQQTSALSFVTSLVPRKVILHYSTTYILLPTLRSSMTTRACQLKILRGTNSLAIPNVVHSKETSFWLNNIATAVLVHDNSALMLRQKSHRHRPSIKIWHGKEWMGCPSLTALPSVPVPTILDRSSPYTIASEVCSLYNRPHNLYKVVIME